MLGGRWSRIRSNVIAAPELWKHSAFRPHLIDVGWGGTWLSASARTPNAVHELQLLHFYRHIGRRAAIQDALGSCPADWSGIRHQAATSVLERLLQMKPRLGHMRVTRWPKNTRDLCHRPLPSKEALVFVEIYAEDGLRGLRSFLPAAIFLLPVLRQPPSLGFGAQLLLFSPAQNLNSLLSSKTT